MKRPRTLASAEAEIRRLETDNARLLTKVAALEEEKRLAMQVIQRNASRNSWNGRFGSS